MRALQWGHPLPAPGDAVDLAQRLQSRYPCSSVVVTVEDSAKVTPLTDCSQAIRQRIYCVSVPKVGMELLLELSEGDLVYRISVIKCRTRLVAALK